MSQSGGEALILVADAALILLALWLFVPAVLRWREGDAEDSTKMRAIGGGLLLVATVSWLVLAAVV